MSKRLDKKQIRRQTIHTNMQNNDSYRVTQNTPIKCRQILPMTTATVSCKNAANHRLHSDYQDDAKMTGKLTRMHNELQHDTSNMLNISSMYSVFMQVEKMLLHVSYPQFITSHDTTTSTVSVK